MSKALWHRAARGADLSPIDDIEDDTYPAYADTRQGNPVRATVVSSRDGNTGYAVTKVEALLSTRQKSGVAVYPEDAGGITAVALDDAVKRNGVAVASDDPDLVHHVATQINAQVVSAPDRIAQIFAGDTHAVVEATSDPSGLASREARVVQRALPRSESGEGVETIRNEFGAFGEVVHDEVAGLETSTATVVHYSAGPVFDSDEIRRQIAAVVEVAQTVDQ